MLIEEKLVDDLKQESEDLKRDIAELELRKANLVVDINKEFFKVKESANSSANDILTEARMTEKSIISAAKRVRSEADAYAIKVKSEEEALLRRAKEEMKIVEKAQEDLTRTRTDFESYKISSERYILDKKMEAERLISESINISKQVTDELFNLNSRQATLDRKTAELTSLQLSLESKERNLNMLADTQTKRNTELDMKLLQLNRNMEENAVLMKSMKELSDTNRRQKEHIDKQLLVVAEIADKEINLKKKFEQIDRENSALESKHKLLEEKEQLLQVEKRKLDESINTLKKLRASKEK